MLSRKERVLCRSLIEAQKKGTSETINGVDAITASLLLEVGYLSSKAIQDMKAFGDKGPSYLSTPFHYPLTREGRQAFDSTLIAALGRYLRDALAIIGGFVGILDILGIIGK